MNPELSIENSDLFFDRELSWLDFNDRVLEEAENDKNPLLEQIRFLCITESNLNEFYMVRVAGLKNRLSEGIDSKSLNGLRNSEIVQLISKRVTNFLERQNTILQKKINELKDQNVHIIFEPNLIDSEETLMIKKYYKEEVSPILTPLAIDPSHPFPHILNLTLNLAVVLTLENGEKNSKNQFAIVQVPSVLPRFFPLKNNGLERRYFPLEKIIKMYVSDLFFGKKIKEIYSFRVMRDADISLEDDKSVSDLLTSMKNELKNRIWGEAVRLDIKEDASMFVKNTLKERLDIKEHEVFSFPLLTNITDLLYFYNLPENVDLKYPFFQQKQTLRFDTAFKIFSEIKKKDRIVYHPYQSFGVLEDLLRQASEDEKVLAIKMTLYRTSGQSPIINYLSKAAENGKQVTVLVELKARFDEERNIKWAQELERTGVHVVYGLTGLKIHCKMLLIVRKEDQKLQRYVHLGTGNYNSITSKYYTDVSYFTVNDNIVSDVATIFNSITSATNMSDLSLLKASPNGLKSRFLELIQKEIDYSKQGKKAKIIFKMNSLVDPDIILNLYKASQAGVEVKLIIRGICCLKPGIKGLSENIRVISIIGRFLEHSRIYYFFSDGEEKIFLASADCMPRNFERRIEIMFPILDGDNKDILINFINLLLKDNVNSRELDSEGSYHRISVDKKSKRIDSQLDAMNLVK